MRLRLILIILLASYLHAEKWIHKYAFAAGVDFAITKGDFDGISSISSDTSKAKAESVILPEIPVFFVYAFDVRALVNASSIAFNFGIGFPKSKHELQSDNARYFRLGLEYQYHFLWPEVFRIGTGLGYEFSSMRFPKGSLGGAGSGKENEWSYANFTGNGPHAVLSVEYYFTENLAAEGAIRYRLLHLNRVATDLNDVSRLSDAVWQSMGELGLRVLFVF